MKDKLNVGLLYLGLHNQLVKKFGDHAIVTKKEFFAKVGRHYILPKNLRPYLLREMECGKLIEKVNRDVIKILPQTIDIEKDYAKLFKLMESYFKTEKQNI